MADLPPCKIHVDALRLRDKSTNDPETGLTVHLVPEGGSYPGDAIALTPDSGIAWQYNFPVGVTNGKYYVYVNGTILKDDSRDVCIHVMRDAIIEPEDTSFAESW